MHKNIYTELYLYRYGISYTRINATCMHYIHYTSAHVQESSFPELARCMDFPPHSVLFQYSTGSTTFSVLILTAGNL